MGADYASILEQGAFDDLDQKNLIAAAAGRVHTALAMGKSMLTIWRTVISTC